MRSVLTLALLLTAAQLFAQEAQIITVRGSETITGVVILAAQAGQERFELQCNKAQTSCVTLPPGNYSMVRLPKNWGLYECANVDVYGLSANPDARGERVGQYCLMAK